MITELKGLVLFSPCCDIGPTSLPIVDFSASYDFLWANNQGWIKSAWVFMGIIPLILLYLIKPFFKIKLWDKTLPATFSDMHTIHCNICKFSRSTCKSSLTTKKPRQMDFWWCGFQNITWTSITTNYNTSFSNEIIVFKRTFSIFENEVLGTTSSHKYGSSTPPTLSIMA